MKSKFPILKRFAVQEAMGIPVSELLVPPDPVREVLLPTDMRNALRKMVATFRPADPSNPVEFKEAEEKVCSVVKELLVPEFEERARRLAKPTKMEWYEVQVAIDNEVGAEIEAAVERWTCPSLKTVLRKLWQSA